MADAGPEDLVDATPGYKAPAKVDIDTLKNLDAEDEALNRWKAQLLAPASGNADDPRKVIVTSMALVVAGRDDIVLDLQGDLSQLKSNPIQVKEKAEYRIRISFR